MYRVTILGPPRVKKNNQKVAAGYNRKTGRRFYRKVNTKGFNQWHTSATEQSLFFPKIDGPIDYPVTFKCTFYMDTKRDVDLSALYEAPQDLFVELGIIKDDNYKIVNNHDGSRVYVDKGNPRMEIEITRCEA